jgi:hypothetical protein
VDGNQAGTVFKINPSVIATLSGMKITNGRANEGAGIYNSGTLNLNDDLIAGNTATTSGGGIFNMGTVNMNEGSSINGNIVTDAIGGGIANGGTINMKSGSIISGNTAVNGGGIANGGTINMESGSIVSGNIANSDGGGIINYGTGIINLAGGSVTSNIATYGYGGGIANGGTLEMKPGSIVSGNTAVNGGGISVRGYGSLRFIDNTGIPITYDPNNNDYLNFFPVTADGRHNIPQNVYYQN